MIGLLTLDQWPLDHHFIFGFFIGTFVPCSMLVTKTKRNAGLMFYTLCIALNTKVLILLCSGQNHLLNLTNLVRMFTLEIRDGYEESFSDDENLLSWNQYMKYDKSNNFELTARCLLLICFFIVCCLIRLLLNRSSCFVFNF